MNSSKNNNQSDPMQSIYFSNFLTNGKNRKIDLKEILLFLVYQIFVICVAIVIYTIVSKQEAATSSSQVYPDYSEDFSASNEPTEEIESTTSSMDNNVVESNSDNFSSIVKTYSGTYVAGQGITNLDLNIISCDEDGSIEAEFCFYEHPDNLGVPSGKFKMQGGITQKFDDGSLEFYMQGVEWIDQPGTYSMLNFTGLVDSKKERITSDDYAIFLEAVETTAVGSEAQIPDSAVTYNSHFYQIYSGVADSWDDAETFCEALGGHLAVIDNADENTFLYNYMKEQGYDSAYFGFVDAESNDTWRWVDGSTGSYTNWADGEPNSLSENYAMYYYKFSDGTWNDCRWGDNSVAFFCEWDTELFSVSTMNHTDYDMDGSSKKMTDFSNCVVDITASSQLSQETYGSNTYQYSPWNVIDNDETTCWSEGVSGYGVEESITLSFDDIYSISEICIWNGLCRNEELYYKNARLHMVEIVFSNGTVITYECADGWDNRKNTIPLSESVATSSLSIIVKSVYEGEKYEDTCISEIRVS